MLAGRTAWVTGLRREQSNARGEVPFVEPETLADGSRREKFDFPPVDKPRAFDCVDAMRPIAEAHGATVAQVAAVVVQQPLDPDVAAHAPTVGRAA